MKILLKIIILLIFFTLIDLQKIYAEEKINIGLLIPLSGEQKEIGKSIMQSVRLAINKIDNSNIQIIPKDTKDDPTRTLAAAKELELKGVKIVIGPIFNKNLIYLDELKEMIFLSLTNKNIKNPKNVISAGINASSQINTIVKFKKQNDINKTIFLIPDSDSKEEIENHECGKDHLKKRKDDNYKNIAKRYDVYMERTKPVLDFYSSLSYFHEIDGSQKIEVITSKIEHILNL